MSYKGFILNEKEKKLIEWASNKLGLSYSAFIRSSAIERALRLRKGVIINNQEVS